jgi:hypothetical protein
VNAWADVPEQGPRIEVPAVELLLAVLEVEQVRGLGKVRLIPVLEGVGSGGGEELGEKCEKHGKPAVLEMF